MDVQPSFGAELRRLRNERGYSLRAFSDVALHSKTVIGDWENGHASPTKGEAAKLDDLLGAAGRLIELRAPSAGPAGLREIERESERLMRQLADASSGELVSVLDRGTDALAVEYLATPGVTLTEEIIEARRAAHKALCTRRVRSPHQARYLTADIGYLSGILAYAALDDGHPKAALTHSGVAWQAGENVGSDQLRAWVRGTESLILRFMQRYPEALALAEDGLRYATSGTARARLLAGVAQCHANMRDPRAARRALTDAESAFDEMRGTDEMRGLFTFSRTKLLYYSGSSLIWLDGGEDARRARDQAHAAIKLWELGGPDRSVSDEALAHVYAATGSLQIHELEEAESDLDPILSLPPERRVSWIAKRMDRIVVMLDQPPYDTDPHARELLERIREY